MTKLFDFMAKLILICLSFFVVGYVGHYAYSQGNLFNLISSLLFLFVVIWAVNRVGD